MKFIPVLSFLLSACLVQAQWVEVPSGTTSDLYDVHFPSLTTGYAVGYYGTTLKTTDGGATWSALNLGTNATLEAVCFLDNQHGFVVGEDGMRRTTDGGLNWTVVALPTAEPLADVEFISPLTGFACGEGGVILKTTDGGNTWALKPSGSGRTLVCIQFPTPTTGYAVAKGYNWEFLKTTDGGETWNKQNIQPILNTSNLEAVWFADANTGLIAGWYISALIKTSDGGLSWTDADTQGNSNLYDFDFPTSVIGYAVGWHGQIRKTTDGGNTWTDESLPDAEVLYAVDFADADHGVIVGNKGLILKTGGSVAVQQPETALNLRLFPNPSHGVIELPGHVGDSRLELYNLQGELVLSRELNGQTARIETPHLPAGVYSYRLLAPGGVAGVGKWVKY